jgi:alkylation response protein AidB-like acyl-CoA dehydrogenase
MVTVRSGVDPAATRAELLDAVARIGPQLAASSNESETQATLSGAAVAALETAGLFRLKLPVALGGAEADPMTQMAVIEALAAIDTASAWCAMVGATGAALLGAFLPEPGLQSTHRNGRLPLAAVSFFPGGVALAEDGSYRLSGRWRFCSGIRHAELVSVAAILEHPGGQHAPAAPAGPPDVIFLAVPVSDVTIHDNWHAMGLKGTGSCDISITNCSVPQQMVFRWDLARPQPQRGGNLYRMGVLAFVACEHIGFALGVARRALDELIRQVNDTRGVYRPSALQDRQVVHRLVGRFDLELAAARALAFERYSATWQRAEAGAQVDAAAQAELQAIATYTTDLAANMAGAAYRYGGASALYQPNILERLLRDIQAAAQHIAVSDAAYETHGKHRLGLVDAGA